MDDIEGLEEYAEGEGISENSNNELTISEDSRS